MIQFPILLAIIRTIILTEKAKNCFLSYLPNLYMDKVRKQFQKKSINLK